MLNVVFYKKNISVIGNILARYEKIKYLENHKPKASVLYLHNYYLNI